MIKIIALIILGITIWTVGCSNFQENVPNNDEPISEPPVTEQNTEPIEDIQQTQTAHGRVVQINKNDEGIVSFRIKDDFDDEYLINVETNLSTEPNLGDIITVTVDGQFSQTSPMQATAKETVITEEFGGALQNVEIYNISGISASTINEEINTSGQIFKTFKSFSECQTYIEEHNLTEQFDQTINNMDISTLTDSFFEEFDLHMLICNENTSSTEKTKQAYIKDSALFLRITETSTDPELVNSTFEIYLIPTAKGIGISEGYILKEEILSDNLSVTEPDEKLPDDPHDDEQVQEGQSSPDAGSNEEETQDQSQDQTSSEKNSD